MPNRKTHTFVGAGSGVVAALLDQRLMESQDRVAFLLGAAADGAVGGRLSDYLEPATSPWHRQFCHGILPCGGAIWATKEALARLFEDLIDWANCAPQAHELPPNSLPLERWGLFFAAGFVKG